MGAALRMLVVAWMAVGLLFTAVEARFYPIEALEPGLRGTGKTVVRGTEIESFEVEFLGVLPQAGPAGDLILIRVSGDVIDRTGGLAAGMSGSPVYIGDALVGAVSYTWDFIDHRIGLATPIGDMLRLMDLMAPAVPEDSKETGVAEAPLPGSAAPGTGLPRFAVLAGSAAEAAALAAALPADVGVFAPVQTPLLASGLSSRALRLLEQRLRPYNLVPVQAGAAAAETLDAVLEPGSAMSVQLVRGDVGMSAVGTVTYVDGDRFIGFGHPFTNQGATGFLVSSAYIHYVVPSLSLPFKLHSNGAPVGSLLQDRGAGVGGRLGPLPYMVPVSITLRDRDRDLEITRQFSVVNDEILLPSLAVYGALGALDRMLDRMGPGTARVVFQIRGEGMPRPLVRDNMFYSEFDVAAVSLVEFMEAVELVVNNRFAPVTLTAVQLVADVEQKRWTAHIESAEPSTTEVLPGESVRITVRLRPYRDEAITEELILTVPPDASAGPVTVVVRGGGWGYEPDLEDEDIWEDPDDSLEENAQDLERLIEEFVRRERNNEIVAEFYSSPDTWSEEPEEDEADGAADEGEDDGLPPRDDVDEVDGEFEDRYDPWYGEYEEPERVMVSHPTDYVILGSTSFDLYILPDYTRLPSPEASPEDEGGPAREALPADTGPEEAAPGDGAPGEATPDEGAPGEEAPGGDSAGDTDDGETPPAEPAPGEATGGIGPGGSASGPDEADPADEAGDSSAGDDPQDPLSDGAGPDEPAGEPETHGSEDGSDGSQSDPADPGGAGSGGVGRSTPMISE